MEAVAGTGAPRKVMVVADPGRESAGALQWALSHAVLDHDELILLHVGGAHNSRRNSFSTFLKRPQPSNLHVDSTTSSSSMDGHGGGDLEFLEEMRTKCEAMHLKVHVQIESVETDGKDKASTILMQAKALSIDLLVIGQRRNFSQTFLGSKLSGSLSQKGTDTAEFLIENSKCLCVGVQKKGQNAGYLLNTKTHRNFWLLA
ncbi:adenine nucleotide alpha hydrolases-like superfamily protein [Tasmannia lanceolata]|uniref:adenine nucleotide alpha hydrolases-like superfamily protein n=1 Tax=Tasmannia lanceolata TaxID=3420 RepID=UPI0040648115